MEPDLVARARVHEYAAGLPTPPLPAFSTVQTRAKQRRRRTTVAAATVVAAAVILVVSGAVALRLAQVTGTAAGGPATVSETSRATTPAPPPALAATLTGHVWTLATVTTAGRRWQPPTTSSATLYLSATGFVVDLGCTLTYGDLTIGSGTITGSGGKTIGGLCTSPGGDQLDTAFAMLNGPADARIETGSGTRPTLELKAGDVVLSLIAHARPAPPVLTAAQQQLIGPVWREVKSGASSPADPTLTVSTTQFTSFDGCGYTFGYVRFTPSGLVLRPIARQDAPCSQASAPVFDAALTGTVSATVTGGRLQLNSAGHALTFERKPGAHSGPFKLPHMLPPG